MGMMSTGIAKSRATASDARADLAEVNSKLSAAQAWLKLTSATDAAVRGIAGTWPARRTVVAPLTEVATTQAGAVRSRAQATVDELQAKKQATTSRLSLAEKTQQAMTKIASETDRLIG